MQDRIELMGFKVVKFFAIIAWLSKYELHLSIITILQISSVTVFRWVERNRKHLHTKVAVLLRIILCIHYSYETQTFEWNIWNSNSCWLHSFESDFSVFFSFIANPQISSRKNHFTCSVQCRTYLQCHFNVTSKFFLHRPMFDLCICTSAKNRQEICMVQIWASLCYRLKNIKQMTHDTWHNHFIVNWRINNRNCHIMIVSMQENILV